MKMKWLAVLAITGAIIFNPLCVKSVHSKEYESVREFGTSQVLGNDDELIENRIKLRNAAEDRYEIPALPDSDFLKKERVPKFNSGCLAVNYCPNENDKTISYKEYLETKSKVAEQLKLINANNEAVKKLERFINEMKNDRIYGGTDIAKKIQLQGEQVEGAIISEQNRLKDEERKARRDNSLSNFASDTFRGLSSATQVGVTAATELIVVLKETKEALAKIKVLEDKEEIVSPLLAIAGYYPEIFTSYLTGNKEKTDELMEEMGKKALEAQGILKNNNIFKGIPAVRDLVKASMAAEDLRKLLSETDFIEESDRRDLQILMALSYYDAFAGVVKAVALVNPTIRRVEPFIGKITAIKAIISGGFDTYLEQKIRRDFANIYELPYKQNQVIISNQSKLLDDIDQQIGQYLLKSRSDVVYQQQNGTIFVATDDVVNPPTGTIANSGWPRVASMQSQLTAITQGGSSHIGSAAYFIGRSPVQDTVREQQFNGANRPNLQERSQYTDGVILQPPVDVVLTWNQNTQLDLDSHLTGPASADQNSPLRFHTYWDAQGDLNSAPNAKLYRDTIPDPDIDISRSDQAPQGPEQTRINAVQPGVYRFYVHNYSNSFGTPTGNAAGADGLSNSGAKVQVYNAGQTVPSFDINNPAIQGVGTALGNPIAVPTGQQGNVWQVFELDTRTGILRRVEQPFGNVSTPDQVPSVNPAEAPR